MRVSVVFDPQWGAKAEKLATLGPVWLIDSEDNKAAASKLWARSGLPPGHVTTFEPQSLSDLLHTVSEHHPSWRTIHVYGASLREDEMNALGLGQIILGRGDGCVVLSRSGA
jgi:hypothetical protein